VIGGTCLNVGCVPSKTLLAASGQRGHALHSPFGGVPTGAGPVDLASVVAQKDLLVTAMRQAKYVDVAAAHGFEVRTGQATFASPTCCSSTGSPSWRRRTWSRPAASRLSRTCRAWTVWAT